MTIETRQRKTLGNETWEARKLGSVMATKWVRGRSEAGAIRNLEKMCAENEAARQARLKQWQDGMTYNSYNRIG